MSVDFGSGTPTENGSCYPCNHCDEFTGVIALSRISSCLWGVTIASCTATRQSGSGTENRDYQIRALFDPTETFLGTPTGYSAIYIYAQVVGEYAASTPCYNPIYYIYKQRLDSGYTNCDTMGSIVLTYDRASEVGKDGANRTTNLICGSMPTTVTLYWS